jgi:hypothetical protein
MWRLGIIGGLACCGLAWAQPAAWDSPKAPPPFIERVSEAPVASAITRNDHNQAYAMLGREDRIETERKPVCDVASDDALTIIARLAANAQIIIINESHDAPRDRAFIEDLAGVVAPLGFQIYAAETFTPMATRSAAPHPVLADGIYSQEPTFGQLLRAIHRLEIRRVAYEHLAPIAAETDFVEAVNTREAGQAANLIQAIFIQNRDAKVLIHVGHGHNREDTERTSGRRFRSREIVWMARRLKDTLKIDPLTIDQTTFAADRSGVCVGTGPGGGLPEGRDIFIAHPPTAFERHRPTWRLARGQVLIDPPKGLASREARVVYEARFANEPDSAVPIDRVMIDPRETVPLALPPGRFKVRAWTQASGWTKSAPLIVPSPAKPTPPPKRKAKTTAKTIR